MISRKVAMSILAILAVGVLVYALNCEVAEAQTSPTWIRSLSTGSTSVGDSINLDRTLSSVQFVESSAWVGSIWGKDPEGVLMLLTGQAALAPGDSLMTIDGITPYFTFPGIRASLFITESGTATVWGE